MSAIPPAAAVIPTGTAATLVGTIITARTGIADCHGGHLGTVRGAGARVRIAAARKPGRP